MSDCEVQAMQRGCLAIARSDDGVIMRHSVKSVTYKGNCLDAVDRPEQRASARFA